MIFGFLTRRKQAREDDERKREEQEAADAHEADKREKRRAAASEKVLDNMRAAREARQAQDAAETDACQTIGLSQASTDTQVRRVKKAHTEINDEHDERMNGRAPLETRTTRPGEGTSPA